MHGIDSMPVHSELVFDLESIGQYLTLYFLPGPHPVSEVQEPQEDHSVQPVNRRSNKK